MRWLCLFIVLASCTSAPPKPDVAPVTKHDEKNHKPGHKHRFEDPETYAKRWNDPARDDWQKPAQIVASLVLEEGMTVVDLGSGTGYLLDKLAAAVGDKGKVIGVDIEPKMVAYLQKTIASQGWKNISAQLAKPDDAGLAPESVDRIVTLNTWHHIRDRVAYAQRLSKALKPGGALVVVDFIHDKEVEGPPMKMRLTVAQVARELEAAGFAVDIPEESLQRHYIVRGFREGDEPIKDAPKPSAFEGFVPETSEEPE